MPHDPSSFSIEVSIDASTVVMRLSGELDADSCGSLVADAKRLVRQDQRNLILDCAGLTFCDSFGLRAMIDIWELVQPDGSLALARPSRTVARVLAITGLAQWFEAQTRANPDPANAPA